MNLDTDYVRSQLEEGRAARAIARELGVHHSTVQRLKGRLESPPVILDSVEEIPVIRRDYSSSSVHLAYPLGDVHKGAQKHNPQRWREWLAYLEERKETSLIGTGDFLNAGLKDSKSEAYDETMTVGSAKRELRRELQRLADQGRIDVLMPGNHEDRIYRAVGDCPILDVTDSLNVPYVAASCLLVYTVGQVEYEVYVRHFGMRSLANMSKSADVIRADVYVSAHTHSQAVSLADWFVRTGDSLERRKRYFLSAGSFVGYETYAAKRGYAPTHLGSPRIRLDGRVHDVHVSL